MEQFTYETRRPFENCNVPKEKSNPYKDLKAIRQRLNTLIYRAHLAFNEERISSLAQSLLEHAQKKCPLKSIDLYEFSKFNSSDNHLLESHLAIGGCFVNSTSKTKEWFYIHFLV